MTKEELQECRAFWIATPIVKCHQKDRTRFCIGFHVATKGQFGSLATNFPGWPEADEAQRIIDEIVVEKMAGLTCVVMAPEMALRIQDKLSQ